MVNKKNLNLVKIFAIICYIAGYFLILQSIILIITDYTNTIIVFPDGYIYYLISIILGIVLICIGKGLNRYKSWARVAVIIIACLLTVSSMIVVINGGVILIFSIIISLIIGYHFLFNDSIKEAFKNNKELSMTHTGEKIGGIEISSKTLLKLSLGSFVFAGIVYLANLLYFSFVEIKCDMDALPFFVFMWLGILSGIIFIFLYFISLLIFRFRKTK